MHFYVLGLDFYCKAIISCVKDFMKKINEVIAYLYSLNEERAESDSCGDLSNLKLQKLLYYIQGHSISILGKKMFEDKILAWMHGPVVKEVYHTFKNFNQSPIIISIGEPFVVKNLTKDEKELIKKVFESYGMYSAWYLRNKTHNERPWQETFKENKENEIKEEKLKNYFDTIKI